MLQAVSDGKPKRARGPRKPKAAADAPAVEAPATFDATADKPKRVRKAAPRKPTASAAETDAA